MRDRYEIGMPSVMLVRAETYNRSTSRRDMRVLKPWLIPCNRPNSRNAITMEIIVNTVRVFLRHSPAQTRLKYFMPRASYRW